MNWHDIEVIRTLDTYEKPCISRAGVVYTPKRVEQRTTVIYTRPRATACKRGHAFTEENTYTDKRGHRTCRMCRIASDTARRARNRAKRKACILD